MESRLAIRGKSKNKIASFPGIQPKKLAISTVASIGKSTPAQLLGRFFTPD
jgi:hypothetical protein